MEILRAQAQRPPKIRAALFDFDGTISTLRTGWEKVMRELMLKWLSGGRTPTRALCQEVDGYIDESTGIQTIHQMKWLAAKAHALRPEAPEDPWFYKAEYNQSLMENVARRRDGVASGQLNREDFLIAGAEAFLGALKERGVRLMVASGTDHPDVLREVEALGLKDYFDGVYGAPVGEESCSKERVIRQLLREENLPGSHLAVVGDGKVEIALGREAGARTLGMATDEKAWRGVSPVKREGGRRGDRGGFCRTGSPAGLFGPVIHAPNIKEEKHHGHFEAKSSTGFFRHSDLFRRGTHQSGAHRYPENPGRYAF